MLTTFKQYVEWHFKRFVYNHLKVWGVAMETDLPPEIYVSKHAEERMIGRIRCGKDKIAKIAMKAWIAREPVPGKIRFNKYQDTFSERQYIIHYREHMGYIFVFARRRKSHPMYSHQKILVTVYN